MTYQSVNPFDGKLVNEIEERTGKQPKDTGRVQRQ